MGIIPNSRMASSSSSSSNQLRPSARPPLAQTSSAVVFDGLTCASFVQEKLISVTTNTSLEEAISVLRTHRISAMPVYDTTTDEWVNVVSHTDLTMTALNFVAEATKMSSFNKNSQMIDDVLRKTTVGIIPRNHGPHSWVHTTDPVSVALRQCAPSPGRQLHRVCIRDPVTKDVVGMLSQLDLLRYIHRYVVGDDGDGDDHKNREKNTGDVAKLRPLLDCTVGELFRHSPTAGVTTIVHTRTVLEAMELMHREGSHGICVVNERNEYVSGFSFSSVRYLLSTKTYNILQQSVGEFCATTERSQDAEQRVVLMRVEHNFKLRDVIRRMCDHGFHRVFVTDEHGHPIDVLTLTDILKLFH